MKKTLLNKFFSFSIGGYISILIGLISVPITTRMLTPEQYGIASIISLIVNILMLIVSLGLDQGFVRFFYEEKEEARGKLLFNCLYYPIFILFVIILGIIFFNKNISEFILKKQEFYIALILIAMLIFTLANRFSILVIRMEQKAKLFSFFTVLTQVLNFLFILLFFKIYKDNYKTIVLATLFSTMITTILSVIIEKKIWSFKGESNFTKRELLKFSLPLSLTMALTWIFQSSDKIIIKIFTGMYEVGIYSAAFKIIALISIIQNGFTTFWAPVAYEKYSKNPSETLFFEKVFEYVSLFFLVLGIFILMSKNLIILLLGETYVEASKVMPMLVFIPIMYTISETTMLGIGFKKQTKYFLIISITVALLNIIGNLILVPVLGAKGAAISSGCVYIVFFAMRTYYSMKLINFKFKLKKLYLILVFMLLYTLYLTFYNNFLYTIVFGIILEILIFIVYLTTIKEIYFKFLKKGRYK